MDNPNQKRNIIIIVILLIIVLLIASFILKGTAGIFGFFKALFYLSIFATIIFVVGVLVYNLFFKKEQIDVTFKHKQGLIRAGRINKPEYMKELWCKGDKTHQAVKIGKIIGCLRIENYGGNITTKEKGELTKQDSQKKRQEDVFIVQTTGFFASFFNDPIVLRISPDDWIGLSKVYIMGINIVEVGQYYYLNNDILNYNMIDLTQKSEALRDVTLDSYSDYMTLIKRAEGLDTEFNKEMDKKKLMRLPQFNKDDD